MNTSTEVLNVYGPLSEREVIAKAAAKLSSGGLVAFPTETVYGLGANALDPAAVARIFAAKGRPANNPLIVHIAETAQAQQLVGAWPQIAGQLAARFWPGPLTLVLPRSQAIPDIVTAAGPTVAVRVPAHPIARALIAAAGVPLAAPSANRSSRLSPTRVEHVLRDLDGRIDLIVDGGPTPGGIESTVLDLTTTPPRVLRPGLAAPAEIEGVIGPIDLSPAASQTLEHPLRSPGMLARHYAPRAPLELAHGDGWDRAHAHACLGQRVGWLTFASSTGRPHPLVKIIVMPGDPLAYAAQLYAVLHALDDDDMERIVVDLPPDADEWLAVRDRLHRAAIR